MTRFFLIRHGETEWNRSGRWQGFSDIPLNETGRMQAQQLAHSLATRGVRFDAIYASDLQRAYETAQIVCASVGGDVVALESLRELDLGEWSGLTRAEVIARDGDVLDRLASGEDVRRGRTGETNADLHRRVRKTLDLLAVRHPNQTVALVSHGGTVRAMIMEAARNNLNPPSRRGHLGNTSVSLISCDDGRWSVAYVNDLHHLKGAAQAADLLAPAGEQETVGGNQ